MSKAFVKEESGIQGEELAADEHGLDLDLDEELDEDEQARGLGQKTGFSKSYMTPGGFARLQDEFSQLKLKERPKVVETVAWAASNGDRSENADYIYGKRRLREIDRRLRQLTKKLSSAEVVDPGLRQGETRVYFGATVTIRNEDGEIKQYSIVGVDESDARQGKVSYLSPIAKALTQAQKGEFVVFRVGEREQELEILEVDYKPIT